MLRGFIVASRSSSTLFPAEVNDLQHRPCCSGSKSAIADGQSPSHDSPAPVPTLYPYRRLTRTQPQLSRSLVTKLSMLSRSGFACTRAKSFPMLLPRLSRHSCSGFASTRDRNRHRFGTAIRSSVPAPIPASHLAKPPPLQPKNQTTTLAGLRGDTTQSPPHESGRGSAW